MYIAPRMKQSILHKICCIGMVFISVFSYAQQATVVDIDKNDLDFQGYFFEALKQYAIHNYSKAIENLESAYKIDSKNMAVEFEFSKNYFQQKKWNEATIFLEKALEKEPENRFLLMHKVALFKGQKLFDKAIEIQQKLVKLKPSQLDNLVALYVENKNFAEANKLVNELEASGIVSEKLNEYKIKIAAGTVKNEPVKKVESSSNLALDLEGLRKEFAKNKEYSVLQKLLEQSFAENKFDVLYADSTLGLAYFPAQPLVYKLNAIALHKLGKYSEAIDVLTVGIDFVFDDNKMEADFYNQFTLNNELLGNKTEAMKYKQKEQMLRLKK